MNSEIKKLAYYIYDNNFDTFKNEIAPINLAQLSKHQFDNGDVLICATAEKQPQFVRGPEIETCL